MLCGRDDLSVVLPQYPDLRLSALCRAIPESDPGQRQKLAADHGIEIEHIRKKNFRKEDRIRKIIDERGKQPGLVGIFSAMEPCATFKPWHNKQSGKTYLIPDQSKCLHYYFYFIDEELGLCYVRVPTWLPCRLQVYFNGHNWLALQLKRRPIPHRMLDNAFTHIGDWSRAQEIADSLEARRIHERLDRFARQYCPIIEHFGLVYHWSLNQCEYATDVVFRRQADLQPIYAHLTRTAIHTVKPDNIATFLGRKLHGNYIDVFLKHHLLHRMLEPLLLQPPKVPLRPPALAFPIHSIMTSRNAPSRCRALASIAFMSSRARVRSRIALRARRRELETESRTRLHGHAGGNPGYSQARS